MTRHLLTAGTALALVFGSAPALAEPAAFDSPEAGAEALIAAVRAGDRAAILEVFGPESEDVIVADDPERNREDREDFVAAWDTLHRVAVQEDGTARIYIGREQWPFPISMVETDGAWRFDVEAGRAELLERRSGRNELDMIELLQAYVAVQSLYRETDHDGDGVMEFAWHIISSEGTRDGLHWPSEDGVPESPVGQAIARAAAEGYAIDGEPQEPEPYLGYYFHILQGQGEGAPGGAYSYMAGENMVGGHALIAFPSAYGETGIMTFMVGENGIVYEADLGEDTLETAAAMELYDPSGDWVPAEQDVN